ncbi:hypothetical protein B296_00020864 [Ensete ventricosum]|uniref:cellulase n=1 Tax=Ensete ventricosum TaxID=4639 RepID=A0A426XQK5_ENSVE|nr:hypothetical protein B296_00020864 [Ensete ventricosum]
MKFGFPMAYTATVLSWSILEYGDQMSAVKLLESALDALKWITDYLINAHPSDNVLYIKRIEYKKEARFIMNFLPCLHCGFTDVAAETAAAMAAASLVFKTRNITYSDLLLQHAEKLFTFADSYRGSYSVSLPQVQNFYNSTGYGDELLWAASWLYHATGDQTYLSYVTVQHGNAFADWGRPTWFSWDDKRAGTQIYDYDTAGGLIWIDEWNALQHPVAASFLAVVYSDYMLTSRTPEIQCSGKSFTPTDLRNFATSQVHHRGASIPANLDTGCKGFKWLTSIAPNPNIATGGLVGGPFKNDSFIDSRNNSMQTEPSTYNSAVLVGLLSGLVTTSSVATSFT